MSDFAVKSAFEKELRTVGGSLPSKQTAYENVKFEPDLKLPYQRVNLFPFAPENPTLGDDYHRLEGFFQIVLSYPVGIGNGDMYKMSDKLRKHFHRGKLLQEDGNNIIVERTPEISPPYNNNSRSEITVRIRYFCEQF